MRVILSCVLLVCVLGQINEGGVPFTFENEVNAEVPLTVLPPINVERDLEESDHVPKNAPFKFGENIHVNYTTENSGVWVETKEGGKLWIVRYSAPEARTINLQFSHFHLPQGSKLFVYSACKKHVLGAFTARNNKPNGLFATQNIPASDVYMEYYHPQGETNGLRLELSSIVHGYRDIVNSKYGESGGCNVNVACDESSGWEDQIRSVALILTSGGSALCSGAMINNAEGDGRQLFLTANHCVSGSDNWILVFNYQTDACKASPAGVAQNNSVHGTRLLARSYYSDFALFEVVEEIPSDYGVYLAGWDRANKAPTKPHGIHHPSGDVKKFCISSTDGKAADYFDEEGDSHWHIAAWESGTTERGSSGSPLFNSEKLIVGQLHGGSASCNFNFDDYYGALVASWDHEEGEDARLDVHLDPKGTKVMSVQGRDF